MSRHSETRNGLPGLMVGLRLSNAVAAAAQRRGFNPHRPKHAAPIEPVACTYRLPAVSHASSADVAGASTLSAGRPPTAKGFEAAAAGPSVGDQLRSRTDP